MRNSIGKDIKRNTSFVCMITIAVLALISSCQDYEVMSEFEITHDLNVNEYTENFIKHYGNIDPNHTWGFGNMPVVNMNAKTRGVETNANEWGKHNIEVPGHTWVWTDENNGYYVDPNGNHVSTPKGDVTDEEIAYVSKWFREHPNPESEIVHWTDFFVQEMCADADRDSYPDGNAVYTSDRYELKDGQWIRTGNGDNITYKNSYFEFYSTEDGWQHLNNFNTNSNFLNESSTTNLRNIMYVTSSGVSNFRAMDCQVQNGDPYKYQMKYVLVHLEFAGESGKEYSGWYMGFDYNYYKQETDQKYSIHPADGYYSNRILKISPASMYYHEGYPKRVMCEDMGNTLDFDFNDVVFDVYYDQVSTSKIEAVITLQAAGGTMPIYVGFDPTIYGNEQYEAHRLFGYDSSIPVNVGGATAEPVIYRIPVTSTNPDNIPVWIVNKNIKLAHPTQKDTYQINGVRGTDDAPQKPCVPNPVRWLSENMFVEKAYPAFPAWVLNEGCEFAELRTMCVSNNPGWQHAWYHNDNLSTNANDFLVIKSNSDIGYNDDGDGYEGWGETTPNTNGGGNNTTTEENMPSTPIDQSEYGIQYTGSLNGDFDISAEYFKMAQSKITITFIESAGANINCSIQEYQTYNSIIMQWGYLAIQTAGAYQIIITSSDPHFENITKNGLTIRNYGTKPNEVYIKCE